MGCEFVVYKVIFLINDDITVKGYLKKPFVILFFGRNRMSLHTYFPTFELKLDQHSIDYLTKILRKNLNLI